MRGDRREREGGDREERKQKGKRKNGSRREEGEAGESGGGHMGGGGRCDLPLPAGVLETCHCPTSQVPLRQSVSLCDVNNPAPITS